MTHRSPVAMSALIAALSGWRVPSQAPSPEWSAPPARPSARQAFEHRAPTPYPVDQSSIPATIRRRLEHAQTTAESGATRWRLEAAALVRVEPDAARLDAAAGLPLAGLRAVAVASDGAVWAGGSGGVVRFTGRPHAWERWQVFSGPRYLPSDDVVALAPGEAGAMWVRTGAGVSHLRLVALSLDDKAVQVEQRLRAASVTAWWPTASCRLPAICRAVISTRMTTTGCGPPFTRRRRAIALRSRKARTRAIAPLRP